MSAVGRFLRNPWTVLLAQVAIGLLFVVSGLAKIWSSEAFALQIHNFRVMPMWPENLVAMTLPWVELLAGLSLVLRVRPRGGALVASVLMAFFTLLIAVALARGLDVECGCFGTADATRVGFVKLGQNFGMLVLSAIGLVRPRS
jgi:uncharacterized membrane protein YphA (DoxX/SURF4 family)